MDEALEKFRQLMKDLQPKDDDVALFIMHPDYTGRFRQIEKQVGGQANPPRLPFELEVEIDPTLPKGVWLGVTYGVIERYRALRRTSKMTPYQAAKHVGMGEVP